jgi:hypothetical protein
MPIFGYLFLGGGVVFGLYAVVTIADHVLLLRRGVRTTGRIIDRDQALDGEYGTETTFTPTIRFKDADGRVVEFQAEESTDDAQSRIGRELAVVYPPGKPQHATIANASIAAPILQLLLSIACAAVGAMLLPR